MAGFEVIIYGRFWVIAEVNIQQLADELFSQGYPKTLVNYLSREEAEALLNAPDMESWSGRRDCALILLALQTGLRLSELICLKKTDLSLIAGAHVRVMGKGRKERCTPLAKRTVTVFKQWSKEPNRGTSDLLLTNARRGQLSADGVQYIRYHGC
jgi:site-specific recombinase XerD